MPVTETRPPLRPLSLFALNVRGQLFRDSALVTQDAGTVDILALTETWLEEGSAAPSISGYEAFNFARPACFQKDSSRGGITIYVTREVAPHVTVHHSDCTNSFVILRVSQSVGYFDRDLYLIVTYIVPRNNSDVSLKTRAVWSEIQECVTALMILQ